MKSHYGADLRIDGQFVGRVNSVEYSRDPVEVPSDNGFRKFVPGEITMDITLDSPMKLAEKWRLLEVGEKILPTDQYFNHMHMTWCEIRSASWYHDDFCECVCSPVQVYRRKALVIV